MFGVALAIVAVIALALDSRSGGVAILLALLYIALVLAAAGPIPQILRALRQEHDLFLIVSVSSALALAGAGAHNVIPGDLYGAILASVVITIAGSTVLVRIGGYTRPRAS